MAAEASPPRWGVGGLPETKRGGLGRRSTEGGSEEEPSVRSSQAGAPVVGDGSVSRIWEEEVIGEGGLWGENRALARERSQGRWPVPTTPSSECAPGSYEEVTGVGGHEREREPLAGYGRRSNEARGCSIDTLGRRVRNVEGLWQIPSAGPGPHSSHHPAPAPLLPLPPPQ